MKELELLLTEFIDRTINEDSQELFKVSHYVSVEDKNLYIVIKDEDKLFGTKPEGFTPVMIQDFQGTYEPFSNIKNINLTIPLYIWVVYDNDEGLVRYRNILNGLTALTDKLVGKFFKIIDETDVTNEWNTVWTTGAISGVTSPQHFNGRLYEQFEITLYTECTKGAKFGNETRYYLGTIANDMEEIFPISRKHDRTKVLESVQSASSNENRETFNVVKTNAWELTLSVFDTGQNVIVNVKKIVDSTNPSQNQIFYLRITDSDIDTEVFPVLIDGATKTPTLGEKTLISFSLVKASEVLI